MGRPIEDAALSALIESQEGSVNREIGVGSGRATILVVAEPSGEVDTLTLLLARDGYRVVRRHLPSDVTELFERERPQAVLMNEAALSAESGELIQHLRSIDPIVPIIVRSGVSDTHQRRRLVREIGLDGLSGVHDDPERLLDLLTSLLDRSRRMAEALAEQELRQLALAKLCHGLRTSMHVIHGYTQILRTDRHQAPPEEVLVRLSSASEGALELLRRYLGDSGMEGKPTATGLVGELVNVDDLVRMVCADATQQIGTRPLRVRGIVPWPAAFIRTNPSKLRAILADLVESAVRVTHAGELQLIVEFGAEQTDFVLRNGDTLDGASASTTPFLPAPSSAQYPLSPSSTPPPVTGLEVAARLSASIGASLTTIRSAAGPTFTLRVPTAALMQPAYRSSTVH
jgi:signal transduction histidine kinase